MGKSEDKSLLEGSPKDAPPKEKPPAGAKAPDDKVNEEYAGDTTDAAMLAASRLTHVCKRNTGMKADDILGYIFQIFLHFFTTMVVTLFAYVWFYFMESLEDPYEPTSVNLMMNVTNEAISKNVSLSNLTFWGKDATVVNAYTKKGCMFVLEDPRMLHILFMGVFMGVIVQRLLKLAHRLYVLVLLPSDKWQKWTGYEDFDEDREKDELEYSMRNWNADKNNVDHMHLGNKIIVLLFIFLPEVLFTLMSLWVGIKQFQSRANSPVKLAKAALKVGFLLKFSGIYYGNFTPHNFSVYLAGGTFLIKKTEEEEEEEEEEAKEADGTPGCWDMWDAWGSTVVTLALGFGLDFLVLFGAFGYLNTFRDVCVKYDAAFPGDKWLPKVATTNQNLFAQLFDVF